MRAILLESAEILSEMAFTLFIPLAISTNEISINQ